MKVADTKLGQYFVMQTHSSRALGGNTGQGSLYACFIPALPFNSNSS